MAAGLITAQYDNGHGGYNHKRNFTLSVADPSGPIDGIAWGLKSLTSYSGNGGVSGTDATQVAYAVNTFDQSTRYRLTSYNGLCVSQYNGNAVYGNVVKLVFCNVKFSGSTAGNTNLKRDDETHIQADDEYIGEFGGWKIKSIEIEKNAKFIATEMDFEPQGPWLPVVYKD